LRQPVAAATAASASRPSLPAGSRPSPPSAPASRPSDVIPFTKPAAEKPTQCPACRAPLTKGAIACLECGYLLNNEGSATDLEGPPHLCANPACGVANPTGERTCQRCGTPLPTAPATVLHGHYRIEQLVAMGGFGAVYQAVDLRNGNRPVAIKDMICADPTEFTIRLNFFRREAEILRSLERLPIVPRVFDLIEQGQSA